ncbi:MAG: DNA-processing protein DprA [Candidatus Portnoybacteria bacterium]|nr:DNA-processing protein DprA [Candidatus Portnoybacteria bacterium]
MIIYKDDKEYPELLKQIKGAPKQLYYKGDFDPSIFENCLAVIGSRGLTSYGERITEQMVGEIAMAGITIVSGFMYGGDAAAHEAAIKAGGRTIAVMPCGIDLIHPAHQEKLYKSILENRGLIISEYEGEMKPALWTYPQRNRIVAGLSKALLVIEAGEKSGCLITANCAKKFGRKIFAAPGPITGSLSKGTNLLIKNGAEMVLSAEDVMKDGGCPRCGGSPHVVLREGMGAAPVAGAAPEARILRKLEQEPMEIDELSRGLEMPVSELSVKLSLMEIKGLVKLRGNKYHIK